MLNVTALDKSSFSGHRVIMGGVATIGRIPIPSCRSLAKGNLKPGANIALVLKRVSLHANEKIL